MPNFSRLTLRLFFATHPPPLVLPLPFPAIRLAPPLYEPLPTPPDLLVALLALLLPSPAAAAAKGTYCSFSFRCRACHSNFRIYSLTQMPYHPSHCLLSSFLIPALSTFTMHNIRTRPATASNAVSPLFTVPSCSTSSSFATTASKLAPWVVESFLHHDAFDASIVIEDSLDGYCNDSVEPNLTLNHKKDKLTSLSPVAFSYETDSFGAVALRS